MCVCVCVYHIATYARNQRKQTRNHIIQALTSETNQFYQAHPIYDKTETNLYLVRYSFTDYLCLRLHTHTHARQSYIAPVHRQTLDNKVSQLDKMQFKNLPL